MPTERRRQVTDVRALRALANPVRYRIFGHLMAFGSQTASECAAVVGATPSNCSYHLRELARFGLVERVDDGAADGRERPWRPTATGFSYQVAEADRADPAARRANLALQHAGHRRRRRACPRGRRATRRLVPGLAAGRGICRRTGSGSRADELVALGTSRRRPHPPVHRPHARRRAARTPSRCTSCSARSRAGDVVTATDGASARSPDRRRCGTRTSPVCGSAVS